MKFRTLSYLGPAMIAFIFILLFWEFIVHVSHIPNDILPAPSTIFFSLLSNSDSLLINTLQTLTETLIGIGIAIILGIFLAVLLDFSPLVRRAIYPLLITSQTVPMIALAPLLLIWLGFDLLPKVIIVVLFCFFPIVIATLDGFARVDQELLDVSKSMNASYWQQLYLIRFPCALPSFFSGLKIAVTYSMTGAMVGEYVGAYQGLGIFIQRSANAHEIPLVFAAIFITATLSIVLFVIVCIIEHTTLGWYFATTNREE